MVFGLNSEWLAKKTGVCGPAPVESSGWGLMGWADMLFNGPRKLVAGLYRSSPPLKFYLGLRRLFEACRGWWCDLELAQSFHTTFLNAAG